MKSIEIFYQTEGLREIAHLEARVDDSLEAVREAIIKQHNLGAESFVFIEDADEPAETKELVRKAAHAGALKVHVHRCRQVNVAVTFNGETVHHAFAPAATIAKVKKWAAEHKFGMTGEEAGEHVLQIAGTHDRPAPNIHIGALVAHPTCHIGFDLVPDERVNGASEPEAA